MVKVIRAWWFPPSNQQHTHSTTLATLTHSLTHLYVSVMSVVLHRWYHPTHQEQFNNSYLTRPTIFLCSAIHSYTHKWMEQPLGAIWDSVHFPRTLQHAARDMNQTGGYYGYWKTHSTSWATATAQTLIKQFTKTQLKDLIWRVDTIFRVK